MLYGYIAKNLPKMCYGVYFPAGLLTEETDPSSDRLAEGYLISMVEFYIELILSCRCMPGMTRDFLGLSQHLQSLVHDNTVAFILMFVYKEKDPFSGKG